MRLPILAPYDSMNSSEIYEVIRRGAEGDDDFGRDSRVEGNLEDVYR